MSAMSDLVTQLQYEIELGELSFGDIAAKYEVPMDWVIEAASMMGELDSEA